MNDLLYLERQEAVALVGVVPSFADEAIFVGVINVACINSDIAIHADISVEGIACLACHTYSIAPYCLTISSVIGTLRPR